MSPGDFLDHWRGWSGEMAQQAATVGVIFHFILGYILLGLLSIPDITWDNLLDWGIPAFPFVLPLCLYFLAMSIYGLILTSTMKGIFLPNKSEAHALIIIPGFVVLCTGTFVLLMPLVRGFLAVMPLVGLQRLVHSMALWPYSGLDPARRRFIARLRMPQVLLTFAVAGFFELGAFVDHVAGMALTVPTLFVLGLLLLTEASWVHQAGWGSAPGTAPAPASYTEAAEPGPAGEGAGQAGASRRVQGASRKTITMAVVLVLALTPFIFVLSSPAKLEIDKAERTSNSTTITMTISVINRGGQAAGGPIELWLVNSTDRFPIAVRDGLGGYDRWNVKQSQPLSNLSSHSKFTVVLEWKGTQVSSRALSSPAECTIVPYVLMVVTAGAAVPGFRRWLGRRRSGYNGL
jgi:hypothetical protein